VTHVNDSFIYNGDVATDCCLPFPENVRAVEEECGHINVTWKSNHVIEPVNTTISWRGVHSSGARHYERGSSEDSHLLTLDYSETGPVEIAVTFSSAVCNKTTVTHYLVNRKRCLTASKGTPTPTPGDVGVTEAFKPPADSDTYLAIGVGVGAALLVLVTTTVVLTAWYLVKKNRSKSVPSSSCGDELKILGSQTSKGCGDPPETPAPTAPETETDSTRPDVIPPVYDDLNTLTRKKEEPLSPPMYHVLEGPTPVVYAQDTHGTETPAPATDIPLYSVVDKSKKKKNTASKPISEDKEKSSPINEPQRDAEKDTSFNSVSL
jgi:hypothetical protein